MKKVLITGAESYIGQKVRECLEKDKSAYSVEELDVRYDTWKDCDFSKFDIVYHVAAIVHQDEKKTDESLYYKVNRDLTYQVAVQAKKSGVRQFVFMSSMSVYGLIYSDAEITPDTTCVPVTKYGKSKLEAEKLLKTLQDEDFHVCIVRPPMVYGSSAPGNMQKLIKLVSCVRIFPTVRNERSSLSIDNLCIYIKKYMDECSEGIFLPQDEEYMCTYDYIHKYFMERNIHIFYIPIFNVFIKKMVGKVNIVTKCFGNLKYKKDN